MKVKALRKKLKKMDPEKDVVVGKFAVDVLAVSEFPDLVAIIPAAQPRAYSHDG